VKEFDLPKESKLAWGKGSGYNFNKEMVIQEYLNNPHVIQGIPHVSFRFCVGLKEV